MTKSKSLYSAFATVLLWVTVVGCRVYFENRSLVRKTKDGVVIGTAWDPRNGKRLDEIVRKREAQAFKEQNYSGRRAFVWPGMRAAQVSWAWLEMLQGLHILTSSEGDYSWMFSKLNFIAQETPSRDIQYLTGLSSFFLVIGSDYIGSNLLMRELQLRNPHSWKTWFWSGFHALENLQDRRMAGFYFRESALRPGAPDHLAALGVRLVSGDEYFSAAFKNNLLENELPKEFVDKVIRSQELRKKLKK